MKLCGYLMLLAVLLSHQVIAKSFKNHIVVNFLVENEAQLKEIQSLVGQSGFTFWDSPEQVNSKLELIIRPENFAMFEEIAVSTNIDYSVTSQDFQNVIDSEKLRKQGKDGEFVFDDYHTLDEINQFMDDIQKENPEISSVFTVGESYEGRVIKGMKITRNENNPAIFIEANIHAREWISSATAVWIINEVINPSQEDWRELVESVTWYIAPVVNPDGYEYTWTTNRLWRKTRTIHNILCRGVDPNRNFGYNWREGGSSSVACSDTYSGPTSFSEKETVALMDFYGTIANKTEAYICFHSAAKMLMYPLGNTLSTELVPNAADLELIAATASEALFNVNGTQYTYGNAMKTLYVTSGSSRDHAYGHFKTPLVFTYEMREGKGSSIFILPKEEIIDNATEVFVSLLAIIRKGKELNYFKTNN